MKYVLLFLLIAVAGNCIYHYGLKSFNHAANPMQVLMLFYAVGGLISLLIAPFFGEMAWADTAALLGNWRVWLVACGFVMIELGFLLAYRAGGSMQWSGIAVNGMASLILIPTAMLLFKEPFSAEKLGGIALTLLGLYLLMRN